MKKRVLVLAGLDPSGGAGLLADVASVLAGGAEPLGCATALTIQTTRAVRGWAPVDPEVLRAQLVALVEEEPIHAVKLGMLGEAAPVVAWLRRELAAIPWVIDPVIRSSSGAELVRGGASAYDGLLAGAVVTPNLAEATLLTGALEGETERAAAILLDRGARAALVKGGHLEGEPLDLLAEREGTTLLRGVRRPGTRRGTGCRLASFLAARLACGDSLPAAAAAAKAHVAAYLDLSCGSPARPASLPLLRGPSSA